MIAGLLERPVVHLGAGSLGRGLVVPVLAANGASVILADADAALVARLQAERAYTLRIGARADRIAIAGALHVDDPALVAALRAARLVTTAVREPNLARAASLLARSWLGDPGAPRVAVACENMRRSGAALARLLQAAGADAALAATPDCVVDRICAAAWPDALTVETEDYLEWSVAGGALSGIRLAEAIADVAPRFDRKRYLVNTYADAMAFLGERMGYTMLHEAASDPALLARIEPLMASLRRLLHIRDGFAPESLHEYQQTARARLANTAIARRLSTVARDLRRKMQAGERFMEPVAALLGRSENVSGAIEVIAAILDRPGAIRGGTLDELRADWGAEEWAPEVLRRIGALWGHAA